jgi:hypothetical protein
MGSVSMKIIGRKASQMSLKNGKYMEVLVRVLILRTEKDVRRSKKCSRRGIIVEMNSQVDLDHAENEFSELMNV